MRTKEQLAQQYAINSVKENWGKLQKEAFLAGWEAAQPKWVSVEDALPPDEIEVVVITEDGDKIIAYNDKKGEWISCANGAYMHTVIAFCDCIPQFKNEQE
jgi:hypothetical protein